MFIFVKFIIVSSNLNIRGELNIKNKKKSEKFKNQRKIRKIKNPKIVLFLFYFLFRKYEKSKKKLF